MYFIFSFLARGMNFTDMAHLNQENIINNRIYYTRAKTRGKQSTSFEILPQMQEILNYFKIHPSKGDYLFPILDSKKHKTKQQQRDRIKTVLRRVNRKLKDIGDALEIEIPLSTYVTRHSWATLQKHQGEPEALISQGLMHNNVQTTQIYLKSFGNTPLDEMNKRLADKVYS
jgi:site-specific recombinase XerD